jgi:hypothetical protein
VKDEKGKDGISFAQGDQIYVSSALLDVFACFLAVFGLEGQSLTIFFVFAGDGAGRGEESLHFWLCLLEFYLDPGLEEGIFGIGFDKLSLRELFDADVTLMSVLNGLAIELYQRFFVHLQTPSLRNYYSSKANI